MLHKADINFVTVAKRGKSSRLKALNAAINKAKANFEAKWNITSNNLITIKTAYPNEFIGLQIVDYYLWALQRMYERKEDRYFNLLAPNFRMIMDIDDKREKPYGQWYTDQNPLTLKKIKPATG